jgi:hypothetical protein
VTLPAWRSLEEGLTRNFADWTITIVPPPLALSPIPFAPEEDAPRTSRRRLARRITGERRSWNK